MLAKECERIGITTVCVTALHTVAERMGANRILKAEGRFHCPFGQPELPQDQEIQWRRKMTEAALKVLTCPVDKPTLFTVEDIQKL